MQRHGRWSESHVEVKGFKAPMYFIRPHDGKRTGAGGRFLDGVTGEGPDVFVTKCGDKRAFMRDRPQRWQWSGWGLTPRQRNDLEDWDKDFRTKDLHPVRELGPSRQARRARPCYNFQTRRFEGRGAALRRGPWHTWSDARWAEGARRGDVWPLSYRDAANRWYTRVPPGSGRYAGGRPRRRA